MAVAAGARRRCGCRGAQAGRGCASASRSGFFRPRSQGRSLRLSRMRSRHCSIATGRRRRPISKGVGSGCLLGLDRFEILFDDGSPLAHVRMTDSGALDTNWHVQSLSLADDVSGALAVEGPAGQVRLWDSEYRTVSLGGLPPGCIFSQLPKEVRNNARLFRQTSPTTLHAVVQSRLRGNIHDGSAGTGFGIGGREDQPVCEQVRWRRYTSCRVPA